MPAQLWLTPHRLRLGRLQMACQPVQSGQFHPQVRVLKFFVAKLSMFLEERASVDSSASFLGDVPLGKVPPPSFPHCNFVTFCAGTPNESICTRRTQFLNHAFLTSSSTPPNACTPPPPGAAGQPAACNRCNAPSGRHGGGRAAECRESLGPSGPPLHSFQLCFSESRRAAAAPEKGQARSIHVAAAALAAVCIDADAGQRLACRAGSSRQRRQHVESQPQRFEPRTRPPVARFQG
jgi:hypothetical protein